MARKLLNAPQKAAGSSEPATEKPKRARRTKRRSRKSTNSRRLRPPIPVEVVGEPSEPTQPRTVLDAVKNIFVNESQPNEPNNSTPRNDGGTIGSELPGDLRAKLDAIPDMIGDSEPDAPAPRAVIDSGDAAAVVSSVAMLEMVVFEEGDVREVLEETFSFLAGRFGSEHWLLTERQSRMLGRPATVLANAVWDKLKVRLPDILGRWCETTPGAAAFLLAAGIVITPKVITQVRLSRSAKQTPRQPEPSAESAPVHRSPRPAPAPGPHIPVMTGVIVP